MELAAAGSPQAIHRLRESGRILGRAIAYCVNLLNPDLVIVGGRLTSVGDHLLMGVRESVYQYSLPLATRELQIAAARGDERSGALGAAQLVIDAALETESVNTRIRASAAAPGGAA